LESNSYLQGGLKVAKCHKSKFAYQRIHQTQYQGDSMQPETIAQLTLGAFVLIGELACVYLALCDLD
jgi:hypothetical protein